MKKRDGAWEMEEGGVLVTTGKPKAHAEINVRPERRREGNEQRRGVMG